MNDRDFKDVRDKVNAIHTTVEVIKTKTTTMEKHLETQNNKIARNDENIGDLQVGLAGMKGSFKVYLAVGLVVIGVIGTLGSVLLQIILGG